MAAGAVATVFVVDDDASVRRALSRLLASVGLVVSACSSARGFLGACDPAQAGCLVLDICIPDLSGLDLQAELTRRDVELPIVFITGHRDMSMSVRAMKAGAVDFLQKPPLVSRIHLTRSTARWSRTRRAGRREKREARR